MKFLLLVPLLLLAACSAPSTSPSSSGHDARGDRPGPRRFHTVVLDAGHGGHDSGARSRYIGETEKNLALDMVRRVQNELGGAFRTVLLRNSDTFIDLDERVVLADRAGDVLLSIHFNSGPPGIRGAESFYWRVDSYSMARRLQRNLAAVSPAASGNRGLVRRRLRLTRNPSIPCVLVECGYLSNPAEARLCADPGYRQRLARAIASAIREQSASGDAGTGPLPRHIEAPLSKASDARE